jgi:superfamily II DNA helicase RecQ
MVIIDEAHHLVTLRNFRDALVQTADLKTKIAKEANFLLFSATFKPEISDQLKRELALGVDRPPLINITADSSRRNVAMHGLIFTDGSGDLSHVGQLGYILKGKHTKKAAGVKCQPLLQPEEEEEEESKKKKEKKRNDGKAMVFCSRTVNENTTKCYYY